MKTLQVKPEDPYKYLTSSQQN